MHKLARKVSREVRLRVLALAGVCPECMHKDGAKWMFIFERIRIIFQRDFGGVFCSEECAQHDADGYAAHEDYLDS